MHVSTERPLRVSMMWGERDRLQGWESLVLCDDDGTNVPGGITARLILMAQAASTLDARM